MTTPNYHPTPPNVAPSLENPIEPSSSKPGLANPEMEEKGTLEKPAKQKMKENGNGAGRHQENPLLVDDVIQIMCHDHPKDIRDGQLVYIERVADVVMLERDGKVENCHEAALAGSHGTTKGDNYLRHDLYVEDLMRPFIPARDGTLAKPKTGAQVLVGRVLTDLQEVASLVQEAGAEQVYRMCTLENKMDECLRHTRINGKLTEDLIKELKAYIDKFKRELPVVLLDSPYNKMKYKKRFKQYHASLSDAAAVEDNEDASS
ncbi:hypothetical protein ZWY2020_039456 [Hordeum vulgare]|nr:hypothetical protein ZWY2020_039456 [Hordeum vulgare]